MSFDFIPLEMYSPLYYSIILFVVLFTFLELNLRGYKSSKWGVVFVLVLILYLGLRPISGQYFGDMGVYARYFRNYQSGGDITSSTDVAFHYFIKLCSNFMSVNFFFLTCAILYTYPLYVISKKWFSTYWFYGFLVLVGSFSFWAYGTNGIRNGIAGSIFLLAVSRDNRILQIGVAIIAISFHKSMLLPSLGFLIAQFYNQPKVMITFWAVCIPLSLAGGSFWESFFASLGFDDERLSYLTAGNVNNDDFSSTGFRWDFLIYSATAVFTGWYFIVKKGFEDKVYFWLFNTYVFANAFWILVIRANFSNRFAYLSWFMMAIVIIYPFLKKEMIVNQNKILANVILAYFAFTFLMTVILNN